MPPNKWRKKKTTSSVSWHCEVIDAITLTQWIRKWGERWVIWSPSSSNCKSGLDQLWSSLSTTRGSWATAAEHISEIEMTWFGDLLCHRICQTKSFTPTCEWSRKQRPTLSLISLCSHPKASAQDRNKQSVMSSTGKIGRRCSRNTKEVNPEAWTVSQARKDA